MDPGTGEDDIAALARQGLELAREADSSAAFAEYAVRTYPDLAEAYLRSREAIVRVHLLTEAFEFLLTSLRPGSIVAAAPNPAHAIIRYYANFNATQMEAFEAILSDAQSEPEEGLQGEQEER